MNSQTELPQFPSLSKNTNTYLVNLDQIIKIQKLISYLRVTIILKYLQASQTRQEILEKKKTELIKKKNQIHFQCMNFLEEQQDSYSKNLRIEFMATLVKDFEMFIRENNLSDAQSILETLSHVCESWQKPCYIKNEQQGYYYNTYN